MDNFHWLVNTTVHVCRTVLPHLLASFVGRWRTIQQDKVSTNVVVDDVLQVHNNSQTAVSSMSDRLYMLYFVVNRRVSYGLD